MSKDGEYINTFSSLANMDESGFKVGTVIRVLNKKQKFAYDSYWVYEEDYLSKNYNIPEKDLNKFNLSVEKYDMNNNYIKTYKTIYEAENDSISSRAEIYRVASGKRKSSRNEKWKFYKTA